MIDMYLCWLNLLKLLNNSTLAHQNEGSLTANIIED
jgi:hypothetical protein